VPRGAGALGIAWNDVDVKYRTLVPISGLSARAVESSLELIHDFRRITQVARLVELLQVGKA